MPAPPSASAPVSSSSASCSSSRLTSVGAAERSSGASGGQARAPRRRASSRSVSARSPSRASTAAGAPPQLPGVHHQAGIGHTAHLDHRGERLLLLDRRLDPELHLRPGVQPPVGLGQPAGKLPYRDRLDRGKGTRPARVDRRRGAHQGVGDRIPQLPDQPLRRAQPQRAPPVDGHGVSLRRHRGGDPPQPVQVGRIQRPDPPRAVPAGAGGRQQAPPRHQPDTGRRRGRPGRHRGAGPAGGRCQQHRQGRRQRQQPPADPPPPRSPARRQHQVELVRALPITPHGQRAGTRRIGRDEGGELLRLQTHGGTLPNAGPARLDALARLPAADAPCVL